MTRLRGRATPDLPARPALRLLRLLLPPLLPLLLPLLLPAGCSQGLLPELDRVLRDPEVCCPRVRSLDRELHIEVSWDEDPAAEEYLLERAEDGLAAQYEPVYRGTALGYDDTGCRDQCRYLYRLSKARGSRLFGPSAAVLGVASETCKDALEPNDEETRATALGDFPLAANLYYYRATCAQCSGREVRDEDWYLLEVPPQRVANLRITQEGLSAGSEYTFLLFYRKETRPAPVVNNGLIAVANPSPEQQEVLLKLYLDPLTFIIEPTLGGGTLVDYEVALHSVTGLQP